MTEALNITSNAGVHFLMMFTVGFNYIEEEHQKVYSKGVVSIKLGFITKD